MIQESLLPIRTAGEEKDFPLLYRPDCLLSVRTSDLMTVYQEGKDYRISKDGVIIPKDSAIMGMAPRDYYPSEPIENGTFSRKGGGYLRFSEGAFFHRRQIAVTYRHSDRWAGPVPTSQLAFLPRFQRRMMEREPVRLLFFGDSIAEGYNTSAKMEAPPYMPRFDQMVNTALCLKYPTKFETINTAVAGTTSAWGLDTVQERVNAYRPDLLVLAFGMNDGSARVDPQVFQDHLCGILERVREKNRDCEALLLTPILPNPEAEEFAGTHRACRRKILELRGEGVGVVDIMPLFDYLLSRKRYADVTGNNINHPNDFTARLYAQAILAALTE